MLRPLAESSVSSGLVNGAIAVIVPSRTGVLVDQAGSAPCICTSLITIGEEGGGVGWYPEVCVVAVFTPT